MLKKNLIVLFFIPLLLHAQQGKTFKIIGQTDYYNNRKLTVQVGVWPLVYNDCMLAALKTDTTYNPNTIVQNGKFELVGTIRYSHPLTVSYYDAENNRGFTSDVYFIDGGDVNIIVDDLVKSRRLGNSINSGSDQEYRRLRKFYSGIVDTTTGSISDMQAKQNLMHDYIAKHPNSYVALWDLVFDQSHAVARNYQVEKRILENMQLFSPLLKQTKTYKALVNEVEKNLEFVEGKQFPKIELSPSVAIEESIKESKFTLIDFWATWCKPCLEQFPELRRIYTKYKGEKFTVIGISVDTKENEGNWKKLIQKFNIDWPQYRDESGREAKKINVESFPTNFLLDDRGKIIRKNISPGELDDFLAKNLNGKK